MSKKVDKNVNVDFNDTSSFANSKFIPLTPISCDDYATSCELLCEALNNKDNDIHNVGVVCGYGGGKSSFIKTFLDRYWNKKLNFERVSLATIADNSIEKQNAELFILRQLLFSKQPNGTKDSNLKRVGTKPRRWLILFISLLCVLALLLIPFGFVLSNEVFVDEIIKYVFAGNSFYFGIAAAISALLMVVALVAAIALFVCNFKNISLKYKDLELEISNSKLDEPFVKYYDELLNFFVKHKVRLVIFEDIDRLEKCNKTLFDELRELNITLNSNEQVVLNGGIVFIYACKPSVFSNGADMNKYFDLIIPIRPILTRDNAAAVLINNEKFNALISWLGDKKFIDKISLYFAEMRILISTHNDCLAFDKKCSGTYNDYSPIEVFTLMAYKNIFPEEYEKLEKGEGILSEVIRKARNVHKRYFVFDILRNDPNVFDNYSLDEHLRFLKMIIKNGYLNENYSQVIYNVSPLSCFNEADVKFIKDLDSDSYSNEHIELCIDADRIIARLDENDYKRALVLNTYLVEYFINQNTSSDRTSILGTTVKTYASEKEKSYVKSFVQIYLFGGSSWQGASDKNIEFLKSLSPWNPIIIDYILDYDGPSKDRKSEVLVDLLYAQNETNIKTHSRIKEIADFVKNDERFKRGLNNYYWIINYLPADFKFDSLKDYSYLKQALILISSREMYAVNEDNLICILNALGIVDPEKQIVTNLLSTSIANYMRKRLDDYLDIILKHESNGVEQNVFNTFVDAKLPSSKLKELISRRDNDKNKLAAKQCDLDLYIFAYARDAFVTDSDVAVEKRKFEANIKTWPKSTVESDSISLFLSNKNISNDLKSIMVNNVLCEKNATDDIIKQIVDQSLVFNNDEQLFGLIKSEDLKIKFLINRFDVNYVNLPSLLSQIDTRYAAIFDEKGLKIEGEIDLPHFNKLNNAYLFSITHRKNKVTIKFHKEHN